MAKMYGGQSKYLVKMTKLSRIAILLYLLLLIYGVYALLSVGFRNGFSKTPAILAFIIAAILWIPLLWIVYRQIKFHRIELQQFENGRKGEAMIYYELINHLPDNFLVFQDVHLPGEKWNIDFLVVGPTGLFALEVKSHSGVIGFDEQNRDLLLNGRPFAEKNILKQAKANAFSINKYLKGIINIDVFVDPVIVFSSYLTRMKFGFKSIDGAYIVQRRYLTRGLTGGLGRISKEDILSIEAVLKNLTRIS